MNRLLLQEGLDSLKLSLNEAQFKAFELYTDEITKWNRKVNLTAIIAIDEIVVKHYIDSLILTQRIGARECILDVGSGAGLPSIPLKIVRPDISVLSVDAVSKKVMFQKHVARLLQFRDFEVKHCRVEQLGVNYEQKFDVITSRAFTNLGNFIRLATPFLKPGGRLLAMKGPGWEDELALAESELNGFSFKVNTFGPYQLPRKYGTRFLIELTLRHC